MVTRLACCNKTRSAKSHERKSEGETHDRCQVGVLKERDQVRLGRLLQRHDGGRLEAQVGLEVLSDLADEALERQLANQELGRLLVATDFTERDRARSVAMGLLDATVRNSLASSSDGVSKTNPAAGADLRAALAASCLRGALPPVDLRAVCCDVAISRCLSE